MPPKFQTKTSKKAVAEGRVKKVARRRDKKKREKKRKVKTWLETPQDWARFHEWAKIKAQPRVIPVEPPIVRPSKPLRALLKRVRYLSRPTKSRDDSIHCRTDYLSVPRAALLARPTERILQLAQPAIREKPICREFPLSVSRATLRYEPTERIIEISKPHVHLPETCKRWINTEKMLKRKSNERQRLIVLSRKMLECPDLMTEEERAELLTPTGVRRTAFTYKRTPWMTVLSLPAFKYLKDRRDEDAKTWKRLLLEEGPIRGKRALAERQKKQERGKSASKRNRRRSKGDEGDSSSDNGQAAKSRTSDEERRRFKEKNAWRYEPAACKPDPYAIRKAALTAPVPARMDELAKPSIRESRSCRKNPFDVKKSALRAAPSSRVDALAKPTRSRSPVQRLPPREKDKYGKPIFAKPAYGKKLPSTKPYIMGQYKAPEQQKKYKSKKSRPINMIAYQPTVDPVIFPDMAKIQKMERKAAARKGE